VKREVGGGMVIINEKYRQRIAYLSTPFINKLNRGSNPSHLKKKKKKNGKRGQYSLKKKKKIEIFHPIFFTAWEEGKS